MAIYEFTDPLQGNTSVGLDYRRFATPSVLSGITEPRPDFALIEELLTRYQSPPPEPPPKLKAWQLIIGALGDAAQAGAAAKMGRPVQGPGPFISSVLQRRQQYEQKKMETEQYNRDLRVRLGIGQFEREQEQAGRIALEGTKSRLQRSEFVRNTPQGPRRIRQIVDMKSGEVLAEDDLGDAMVRPFIKDFVRDVEGQPRRIRHTIDSQGVVISEEDLGPAGYAPVVLPSIPGVAPPERVPRSGPSGPLRDIIPPAPPGQEQEFRKQSSYLIALESVKAAHRTVRQKVGNTNALKQFVLAGIGGTKYGGAFDFSRPYADYIASVRSALNGYVLSQTGLSFPEAAFKRYEAEFPQPWDDEKRASELFTNVARRAIAEKDILQQQYPGVGGGGTSQTTEGMSIRRSQLRSLPSQDAADTEADAKARGIQIIED